MKAAPPILTHPGNLPTEKVTKRDIFHRFYRHGKLAQISIKQAYGFVQFLDCESCRRALQAEQGQAVRGRKMRKSPHQLLSANLTGTDLEVSKPQRNAKKAEVERNMAPHRRSRSPDYNRGGGGLPPRSDRYGRSSNPISPRDRDSRRAHDDYRPMRSPSPRDNRGYRSRDKSRDRYDQRRRSRSRSPRRYRSPSPRRSPGDGLPLPFRASQQVPEVQILVLDPGLPNEFTQYVEDSFRQAGLRVDVLKMSPRLDEGLVVRRQIVEGVLAIVKLNATNLARMKINIEIFDRKGGADKVEFNEYADLDPPTAAALVIQSKQASYRPVPAPVQAPTTYGQVYQNPTPVFPYTSTTPTSATNSADLSKLLGSLDPNSMSQLLGALGSSAAQTPQPPAPGITSDLARLLSSVSNPAAVPTYEAPALPPQSYANPYQNPSFAQFYGGQASAQQHPQPTQHLPPAASPGQPDMNEIMAQLAKYQR